MTTGSYSADFLGRYGLTVDEYRQICQMLGREPNHTELGIFSAMWSEHCSYKSSKLHLKRLPTRGPCVVQGPGENAGIVDIGDGLVAVFKIESHNHPSYIEPYQGAATGVGGILRDIFTMGARPIAILDALHFGFPSEPKNRLVLEGVVAGIAGYGNCMGIPTVGGQTFFSRQYAHNPLVNVLGLGIAYKDRVFYGRAAGVGNLVIYAGAGTGRDGIHGATMASEEFDKESHQERPTVQVGDPFMEKLLLEACLEAMRSGCVAGIQDMGAAGLACSASEMGSRAGTGIEIDLDLVPLREDGMSAYEIMLSESQERMLLVTEPAKEAKVRAIFERWGLDAVAIGRVTDDGKLRVLHGGQVAAEICNHDLTGGAPVYDRPLREPAHPEEASAFDESSVPPPRDWKECLRTLVSSPNLCCRQWIWEQYDHMVRTNTLVGPGSDAAVLRVKGGSRLLAISTDSNPRVCYLDPAEGARAAVAEACRNVVCAGAQPLAATDCLNFASPENPEVMWQFSSVVDGIRDACEALGTPITGGNVSFYNETNGAGVFPTPVIGMIGVIEDLNYVTPSALQRAGDVLLLLGPEEARLTGSEYLELFQGRIEGAPAPVDLKLEKKVQEFLAAAIRKGWVRSAHDCSEGGLLMAALESALTAKPRLGLELNVRSDYPPHRGLFGEGPSRILLTVTEDCLNQIEGMAQAAGVPLRVVGRVVPDTLRVLYNGEEVVSMPIAELFDAWHGAFESWFYR
jgi:phosphoribosylformylglycinamidine synthase